LRVIFEELIAMEANAANKKWAAPFFSIWSGQALSLLGSQLVQFALVWWLTKTTGSATVLATATLVGFLPQVMLGPLAGTLVDRWNRRVTMIAADGIIALATLGLMLLFWTGQVQIWHVYLLMFIRASAGGFHWPAMQASTTLMVPKEHLSRIQGLNQMLNGGMSIASAPLGALLMEVMPVQGILSIDVGTALLAILPLFFVAVPQPEKTQAAAPGESQGSVWAELRAGLKYVWGWPGLVMILIMATLINVLLNPAFALMPILITKHFGGGALQLAWMESSWGIGVIAGGLLLSVWGGFKRRILTSLLGLMGIGLGSLGVGLAPASALGFAIGAMLLSGIAQPLTNGPLIAVLQSAVAPEMQGRVFTLVMSSAAAMTPLGLMVAGPLADNFGVQTWFIVGGVATILMGLTGLFIPAIMHIEDGRGDNSPVVAEKPALAPTPGD